LLVVNAGADEIGGELDADVGLAFLHAIPFFVTDHAAARENAGAALAHQRIVALPPRPPADAERRGRAPVHRPKAHPLAGDREWIDNVALVLPAIEERAERDRPAPVEPGAHELAGAGAAQPVLVGLDVDVLVVVDPRRNEDAFQMRQWVNNDLVSSGCGINIASLDPVMSTST